jgi:hypothetical protein
MPLDKAIPADRLFRLGLLFWAVLTIVVCVRTFLHPDRATVYPIFAEAARSWCRGEDTYRTVLNDVYRYSPPATVLLVPFALLPDAVGGVLWRLVSVAAYLGALIWWARAVLPRPQAIGSVLWLVVPLSLGNVNNGQSNVLLLAALLTTAAAVAVRYWSIAAAAAVLACLFKAYPLAVALLLAALYPKQFAGRFFAALLVSLALPFLCQQPEYAIEQYRGWIEHLRQDDRQQHHLEATYRDVRLLFRVAGAPLSGNTFLALQLGSGAAVFGICLLGRRAGWSRRKVARSAFDLGCCWMVLFGPATESNTYMLLAPTLAWSLAESIRAPRSRVAFGLTALAGALLLTCCVAGWFPVGKQFRALGLQPLGGLLLAGGLLCRLGSRSEASPNEVKPAEVPIRVVPCEPHACS